MSTRWYCLQMDARSAELGEFWAGALGAEGRPSGDQDVFTDVYGPGGLLMQVASVPEPKTVKHRVHLDLNVRSLEQLTAAGATILHPQEETGLPWTVLQDPEGGEFCVFLRDQPPAFPLRDVIVDCHDAETIAKWWAGVFGVSAANDGKNPWWWVDRVPGMPFENLVFVPVPEPKTVKNRIHWDLWGDVAELRGAGARVLWEMPRWVTMADPEGNEFCVFAPTD